MKSYRKNRIPQIIFGCDAAKETGKELQNQCVTRCLIVTDKGVRAAGLVDPILASLDACGISYIIFGDVKPETPDTVCLELAETIRNNQLDGVLADFFEGKELSNVIGLVLAGSGFWGFVFSNVSGFVGGKFGWKIAYLLHLYAVIPLILFL